MIYLFVLPVRCYRTSEGLVATESSFLEHLRMTRDMLQPLFTRIVIASPPMPAEEYELNRGHLGHFSEDAEQIQWTTLRGLENNRFTFAFAQLPQLKRTLLELIDKASLMHAGISMDLYRPYEFIALKLAHARGLKTVFVVDIDERKSIKMRRDAGTISTLSYWANRLLFDPLRSAQIRWACKNCSIILLKGESLVRDFGAGRGNVRNIYDVSHSAEHVIPAEKLEEKISAIRDSSSTIKLIYFGRLVTYKGIDHSIRAAAVALESGANITLSILGDGPEKSKLEALADELGVSKEVQFLSPISFGQSLFDELYRHHLLLANPLTPDTPRSAFDALAAGCSILAYATDYYESITSTGSVEVTPWNDWQTQGKRIAELSQTGRATLEQRARSARKYASDHTQESWMKTRISWIKALYE